MPKAQKKIICIGMPNDKVVTGRVQKKAPQPVRVSKRTVTKRRDLSPALNAAEELEQQMADKVEAQNREIARLREQMEAQSLQHKAELSSIKIKAKKAIEEAKAAQEEESTDDDEPNSKLPNPKAGEKKPWTDAYQKLRHRVNVLICDSANRAKYEKLAEDYLIMDAHPNQAKWARNKFCERNALTPMPKPEVLAGMDKTKRSMKLNYSPAAYVLNNYEEGYRQHCAYMAMMKKRCEARKATK